MKLLWLRRECAVADLVEALADEVPLAYTSVLTTVRILEKKGYVTHRQEGRARVHDELKPHPAQLGHGQAHPRKPGGRRHMHQRPRQPLTDDAELLRSMGEHEQDVSAGAGHRLASAQGLIQAVRARRWFAR